MPIALGNKPGFRINAVQALFYRVACGRFDFATPRPVRLLSIFCPLLIPLGYPHDEQRT